MTLEIAILDSLVDDFESLEQIETYLHFLGFDIQINEIRTLIQELIERKLVYIVESVSDDEIVWYGLTKEGKAFLKNA